MGSQLTGNRVSTGDDARDLDIIRFGEGGKTKKKSKSKVNEAGNYTQPDKRKRLFNRIKSGGKDAISRYYNIDCTLSFLVNLKKHRAGSC